jgi:hypothetical protein
MKNEKNFYIVVGILSVVVCGFLFFHSKPTSSSSGGTVTYGQVDQLRKTTQIKKALETKKVAVDNYNSAPSLSAKYHAVEDQTAEPKSGLNFESQKHAVVDDEAELEGEHMPTNMLEVQINKKLVNDQKAAELSAQQKKLFIANYKKQALAKGYIVELNDQLVVTKVEKVRGAKGPASMQQQIPQDDVEIEEFDDDSAE